MKRRLTCWFARFILKCMHYYQEEQSLRNVEPVHREKMNSLQVQLQSPSTQFDSEDIFTPVEIKFPSRPLFQYLQTHKTAPGPATQAFREQHCTFTIFS